MKNQKQNNSRLPMTSTPAKLSRASLAITAGRLLASDAAYQRCGDISKPPRRRNYQKVARLF